MLFYCSELHLAYLSSHFAIFMAFLGPILCVENPTVIIAVELSAPISSASLDPLMSWTMFFGGFIFLNFTGRPFSWLS